VDFSEIYDDVITARFKATQTTQIKRWINLREAQIWAAAEWPWKIVGPTALVVTAADNTPALPADIDRPTAVYDDNGYRLSYLIQTEFDDAFLPSQIASTSGRPSAFKWNNGVLTLGVVPSPGYSFTLTYLRKLCHYASGAVITSGPMTADTDYPIFDTEWHEILVIGAIATGLKLENDPTWQSLEQEFALMLSNMADHYLPAVAVAGNMQYGADRLR
jgi:hypothetical protein